MAKSTQGTKAKKATPAATTRGTVWKNDARSVAVNIGIPAGDRGAIAGGLSKLLADTYTLYLTTQPHVGLSSVSC